MRSQAVRCGYHQRRGVPAVKHTRRSESVAAQRGEGETTTTPLEPADRERARAIPEAAVARLAVYLRVLSGMTDQGITAVSSEELSQAAGVNAAKLRKDLSYIGSYGDRKSTRL